MPSSNPISMNEVRTNGAGLYVSMFFSSRKLDTEGSAVDQFYWVRSNANGAMIDERDNKIPVDGASWWSDKATALANVPVGYDDTQVESNFESEKVLSYLELFPLGGRSIEEQNASILRTKNSIDSFVAAGGGAFILVLRWENVFLNMTEQNANADSSWARYDDIVNHAKNKGIKVSFRICVDLDDNTVNVNGTGVAFYGLDNSAKDEWGYPARIEYGFGHCSLSYPTGTAMIFDFVQKALTRYKTILGSQMYWYSVTTTAQQESGYNYENQNYDMGSPGDRYKCSYDYSTHAHTSFKNWCRNKYSNNISTLNTAWGSSFGSFDDITMPKSNQNSPGTTSEVPYLDVFKTTKGKDWWLFTYETIKAFQTTCYNLRPTGVKYFLEYGSCSDIMSALRYSCFVMDAVNYSDGLKAQFGAIEGKRDLSFSLDVIRSNYPKKKGTEVNSADVYSDDPNKPAQYGATTIPQLKDIAFQLAKSAIDSQAREIIIISDYQRPSVFSAMMEVTASVKNYLTNFNSTTPTVATIEYNLGELLNNYESVIQRWRNASGDTTRRVNIIQSSTLTGGGGTVTPPPNPLTYSLYNVSFFNYRSDSLKSSVNAQYPTPGAMAEYNIPNTFFMNVPTHSINYLDEFLAKSTIKIVGSDGFEYVRSTQYDGVFKRTDKTQAQLDSIASNYPSAKFIEDGYGNNHPDRRFTGTSGEDAVFILPYNDTTLTWYDVTIENTGISTVLFDVYSPDQIDGALINFVDQPVAGGSSYTFRINVSLIRDYPWWRRGIKVNNNRR